MLPIKRKAWPGVGRKGVGETWRLRSLRVAEIAGCPQIIIPLYFLVKGTGHPGFQPHLLLAMAI